MIDKLQHAISGRSTCGIRRCSVATVVLLQPYTSGLDVSHLCAIAETTVHIHIQRRKAREGRVSPSSQHPP